MNKEKILKAGKIANQVREYAKTIIKKDMLLLEIAEKIESKIIELGGKPAFPTNLSIDEIAAHYTPPYNDETKASGLLKVDFGVHINGFLSDTALSFDLEDSEKNKSLIQTAEKALENAISLIEKNKEATLGEIGKIIQETIEKENLNPIINLSGHSMEKYDLHSGITIPNIDNNSDQKLKSGLIAIEPFVTSGSGRVYDGKPSGIYFLQNEKNIRSPIARETLSLIIDKYQTLPFCSRWIVKEIGTKALFGLKQLEEAGILYQFPQLIEASKNKVAQAEHTVFIDKEVVVTTK